MGEDQVLYFIKDHKGACHAYTEVEFHRQIMEDAAQSDYDWCAPVTEISKAVRKFKSQLFRDDICRAVLDCFSRFLMRDRGCDESENIAIWECFMELSSDSAENHEAKANYVNSFLRFRILWRTALSMHGNGPIWNKLRQDFIDDKNREWPKFRSVREIIKWADAVDDDFDRRLKKAEEKKLFEKEDNEHFEYWLNKVAHTRAWEIPD